MIHAEDIKKYIFGYIMNQMSAKDALKKHEKEAEAALMKKFAQLEALMYMKLSMPAPSLGHNEEL